MEVEQNVNLEENLYLLILREYFFFKLRLNSFTSTSKK